MKVVDFQNLVCLPKVYYQKLTEYSDFFRQVEHIEKFDYEINNLIFDINKYCEKCRIVGYHYTRAYPESINKYGLLVRSGDEIRQSFIKNYGHFFTEEEIKIIKNAWMRNFTETDCESRDNRIFFNFTLQGLKNGGAHNLLNFFGGEQIYFPLMELKNIIAKLSSLGLPLIAKCNLDPKDLTVYIQEPWGRIAVSAFHRKINKNASVVDQDGFQSVPVNTINIEIMRFEEITSD